jgi:hypothetical protein
VASYGWIDPEIRGGTGGWDGKSNEGEAVGPGVYMLMAPIFSDQPIMNGMTRIEVTGR